MNYEFEESVEDEQREKIIALIEGQVFNPKPRLSPLSNDENEFMSQCWITKLFGVHDERLDPLTNKLRSNAVFLLKSSVWPGFHIFYKDAFFFNLYIGNGLKYSPVNTFYYMDRNIKNDKSDPKMSFEFKAPPKKIDDEQVLPDEE